jgi:mannose-6-phosphate isomerase
MGADSREYPRPSALSAVFFLNSWNLFMLYPLRFEPIFRRYLWGGRRLGEVLHKQIGEGADYAESWEIVDHGVDQSRVAAGPLAGATLAELVLKHNRDLFGRHVGFAQFPLLFKFLDARQTLSVQVHPNDEQAARLVPPDRGKTEAWVVLAAEPGSLICAGLKRGFDRHAFERELTRGAAELCLHRFEPRPGDCVLLPAGTVHALGAGLLIAEIQQSSDTTYRLHDWSRVGPDGKPRALHIDQALAVTEFDLGPVDPIVPQPTEWPHGERLAASDKFVLDRWRLAEPQTIGGGERFHIVAVLHGAITVAGDPAGKPLQLGETMLLPAELGPTLLSPHDGPATLLDIYLP